MAAKRAATLNPGVRPIEAWAWSMFDFANSGYTMVVITAVFNAYFVARIAGNANWASLAWTLALALSYALIMVSAPAVGAYADRHLAKKRLLALTTLGCVVATAGLGLAGPGDIWLAAGLVVVSNFFSAAARTSSPPSCPNWRAAAAWAVYPVGAGAWAMSVAC